MSVLLQKRSILTARLAKRGYHLSREYGVDPLETVLVAQAMHTSVFALPANATRRDAAEWLRKMEERGSEAWGHWQRLFPLLDNNHRLVALITRTQMMASARQPDLDQPLAGDGNSTPTVVGAGETLRSIANLMASTKITGFPVVDLDGKFVGITTIEDLLAGRSRERLRESDRTRVLRMRWPFSSTKVPAVAKAGEIQLEESAESVAALDGED
jgi:CBS domain-containing protein